MFLPAGDQNPRLRFPVVTLSLIFVNTAVFLGCYFRPGYDDLLGAYGFVPGNPGILQIFTSMFLHVDNLHLLFNMWFLWVFGDNLEDKFRKSLFLAYYLAGGIFSNVVYYFAVPSADRFIPAVGASGAISAVMGGYMVLFPKAWVVIPTRLGVFRMSALLYMLMWFGGQLYYASSQGSQSSSVAYAAHVGGFAVGAVFSWILRMYYLTPQDLVPVPAAAVEKDKAAAQEFLAAAVQEESRHNTVAHHYSAVIDGYMKEGAYDMAEQSYAEFERQEIAAGLSNATQMKVAGVLEGKGSHLLALQAYMRFLTYAPASQLAGQARCKAGLLLLRQWQDIPEGLTYLYSGIVAAGVTADPVVLEARQEFSRYASEVYKRNEALLNNSSPADRWCILPMLADQGFYPDKDIFNGLFSIGMIGTGDGARNMGLVLAYRFKALREDRKSCALLAGLRKEEAQLALGKFTAMSLPVAVIPQEQEKRFSPPCFMREVEMGDGRLRMKGEEGGDYVVPFDEIILGCFGQLMHFSASRVQEEPPPDGVFSIDAPAMAASPAIAGTSVLDGHQVFDLFTRDLRRLRVDNPGTSYEGGFRKFLDDFARMAGIRKIDDKTELFLASSRGVLTNFKSLDEFDKKSLLSVNLSCYYDRIFPKSTGGWHNGVL